VTLAGKTAFVTGGTGFIGGRLIEVLTAQYGMNVRALVRNSYSGAGAYRAAGCGAELVEGDITDADSMVEAVNGCDFVFHCAFGTTGDAKMDRAVTVDGTASLARAAAANGVEHFVHLSTMVIFGDTPPVVDETFTPTRMWDWPYPHQKRDAERAVLAENGRSGLPTTILRLGSIYGPWGPAFTYYPIASLKAGRVVLVDDGTGVSNAAYIDDVIQAMILAAKRGNAPPDMFIIRGPDQVTWRQFYDAYEAMLGTDSLVSMSLREVRRHQSVVRRSAVKRAVPAAMAVLKRDDAFKKLAGQLPLLKPAWKFYRKHINQPADVVVAPDAAPEAALDSRPLVALPEMMWGSYALQTDFKIDRARNILGYNPQYDLAKGMALTEEWARWANLIDPA
jgi:nucleoside-diphosphate-sugar epimerase